MSFIQLGRYRDPPRRLNFDTWRFAETVPQLGGGYRLGWTANQDVAGNPALAPIQVTRLLPAPDRYGVEAEEMLWTFYDGIGELQDRVIVIPSNVNNVNLRELHDSIYPELTEDDLSASPPVTLTCIINAGVIVGSTSIATPAFDVGDWLPGFTPLLQLNGRIQGTGGAGGEGGISSGQVQDGEPGGTALYTRHALDVEHGAGAEVWGGGGGGAGGDVSHVIALPGGGGAGTVPGAAGAVAGGDPPDTAAQPGTSEDGGEGGDAGAGFAGGAGGDPGMAGENVSLTGISRTGGAAGAAIDGVSFVNVVSGSADIRGGQIN
jgi:hypothetical protein